MNGELDSSCTDGNDMSFNLYMDIHEDWSLIQIETSTQMSTISQVSLTIVDTAHLLI